MRITCTCEIHRPPQDVFPWLADPQKAMQWQGNVKEAVVLVHRPDVVGTTFKEVIEENGGRIEMRGVITRHLEGRAIEFQLESRLHRLTASYSVEGTGPSTKLQVDAGIRWKFPLSLIVLFIGRRMRQGIAGQMESELRELKRICESA